MDRNYGNHGITVLAGDAREKLKALSDNSIDSIVTDPPYALVSVVKRFGSPTSAPTKDGDVYSRSSSGFMGQQWDTGETAFAKEFWQECLRVLKPGGYVLSFGATRSYHRLACAIEDAGFEIRDCIMWVYGTGFPKSHDVSKQLDKRRAVNDVIRPWLMSLGDRKQIASAANVTPRQVDHWLGENTPCPQTLGEKAFIKICNHFNNYPEWYDEMIEVRGEFVGEIEHSRSGGEDFAKIPLSKSQKKTVPVFSKGTDEAKQWEGWGSALKPAVEPIVMARKPVIGAIAENVLEYGTGAINIDGCRVGWPDGKPPEIGTPAWSGPAKKLTAVPGQDGATVERAKPSLHGRWPANLIHDGSDEVVEAFPTSNSARIGNPNNPKRGGNSTPIWGMSDGRETHDYRDSGSAARFFYSAKASKKEKVGNHPTQKPIALMQYLCRLVTPEKGTVLDPFAGTGTTAEGAWREGFNCVLVEREEEYVKFIHERIASMEGRL